MRIGAYSYKGGTGRSVSIANIATVVAKKGFNVGIIDADVEAPGMADIFDIEVPSINLLDLLSFPSAPPDEQLPPPEYTLSQTQFPIVDVKREKSLNIEGKLFLLPSEKNKEKLKTIPNSAELVGIFHNIMSDFTELYKLDFVFVDCRSGIADFSVLSLFNVEKVLLFLGWGKQHIKGSKYVITQVLGKIPKSYYLVPSRIPTFISKEDIKNTVKKEIGQKIVEIIYQDEDLSWEERLIVLEKPESTTSKVFDNIAEMIIKLGGF